MIVESPPIEFPQLAFNDSYKGMTVDVLRPKLDKATKKWLAGKPCKYRFNYRMLEAANGMLGDIQANHAFLRGLARHKLNLDKRSLKIAVHAGKHPKKR